MPRKKTQRPVEAVDVPTDMSRHKFPKLPVKAVDVQEGMPHQAIQDKFRKVPVNAPGKPRTMVPALSRFGTAGPTIRAKDGFFDYDDCTTVHSYQGLGFRQHMVCFPVTPDMIMTNTRVRHVDNFLVDTESSCHEESTYQTCEQGCAARDLYERNYKKEAAKKINEYETKSRVYLRSDGCCAAVLPSLKADDPEQTIFVVVESDNVQLHRTDSGELVKILERPTLTSYTINTLVSLPLSYDDFAECFTPRENKAKLNASFTKVHTVDIQQFHQHLSHMPSLADLLKFNKVLGLPSTLLNYVNPTILEGAGNTKHVVQSRLHAVAIHAKEVIRRGRASQQATIDSMMTSPSFFGLPSPIPLGLPLSRPLSLQANVLKSETPAPMLPSTSIDVTETEALQTEALETEALETEALETDKEWYTLYSDTGLPLPDINSFDEELFNSFSFD